MNNWTSCEVALPKESGLYLVTETAIIDDYIVTMRYFNRTDDLVCWSGHEYSNNPIAWMELPKPYIPEENEL